MEMVLLGAIILDSSFFSQNSMFITAVKSGIFVGNMGIFVVLVAIAMRSVRKETTEVVIGREYVRPNKSSETHRGPRLKQRGTATEIYVDDRRWNEEFSETRARKPKSDATILGPTPSTKKTSVGSAEVTRLGRGKTEMFCPRCGARIPRDSRFCKECGTKLE